MSTDIGKAPRWPREHTLSSGRQITLRAVTEADQDLVLAFARRLPDHDLLFLLRDITQPAVIRKWLAEAKGGHLDAVVAEQGDALLGMTTVIPSREPWSSHVGEIRVLVDVQARGSGLGRLLVQEAFAAALHGGLERMVARMTPDQEGAIAVFTELGFSPEGVLRDHIRDRVGNPHDLLIMGHDVNRFGSQLEAYGVAAALGGSD